MAYIDTSVIAAYYCPEPLSAAAQEILQKTSAPAISTLVEVELASVLSMKVRGGYCDAADAKSIFAQFQLHIEDMYYRLLPIRSHERELACGWLMDFAPLLRTLDSLHLATAFANDEILITADTDLAKCAQKLGVRHQFVT